MAVMLQDCMLAMFLVIEHLVSVSCTETLKLACSAVAGFGLHFVGAIDGFPILRLICHFSHFLEVMKHAAVDLYKLPVLAEWCVWWLSAECCFA